MARADFIGGPPSARDICLSSKAGREAVAVPDWMSAEGAWSGFLLADRRPRLRVPSLTCRPQARRAFPRRDAFEEHDNFLSKKIILWDIFPAIEICLAPSNVHRRVETLIMIATKKVYLIDDDEFLREAAEGFFRQNGYRVTGFPSADAFLAQCQTAAMPDARAVIISDVRMPGRSGLDLLRTLNGQDGAGLAGWPVILLSGHANIPLAVEAMRAGAVNVLEKPLDPERLLQAVEAAFDAMAAAEAPSEACARRRLGTLTPREREVLGSFIASGSNKGVARDLGMSPRTVEIHRARILQKSGATSVPELVRLAVAAGLVGPPKITT